MRSIQYTPDPVQAPAVSTQVWFLSGSGYKSVLVMPGSMLCHSEACASLAHALLSFHGRQAVVFVDVGRVKVNVDDLSRE